MIETAEDFAKLDHICQALYRFKWIMDACENNEYDAKAVYEKLMKFDKPLRMNKYCIVDLETENILYEQDSYKKLSEISGIDIKELHRLRHSNGRRSKIPVYINNHEISVVNICYVLQGDNYVVEKDSRNNGG